MKRYGLAAATFATTLTMAWAGGVDIERGFALGYTLFSATVLSVLTYLLLDMV